MISKTKLTPSQIVIELNMLNKWIVIILLILIVRKIVANRDSRSTMVLLIWKKVRTVVYKDIRTEKPQF
jgi:hypothetical protein